MTALADGEVEREARRILRKLTAPGAHLRRESGEVYRTVCRSDAASSKVTADFVTAWQARGWLDRTGDAGFLVLSDAGAGWLARATAQDSPFAAQHQLRSLRKITGPDGKDAIVLVDDAESPIARMYLRKLIDGVQRDAAERLRRDFTLARLTPRLGVDLTAPMVTRSRGQGTELPLTDTVLAAKQRFAAALHAVGPGLNDLLFDVCCHLRGLAEAERAKAWPVRSAKVVLTIALDRLADHYGLRVRGRAKMRGWRKEAAPEQTS